LRTGDVARSFIRDILRTCYSFDVAFELGGCDGTS
jgi:hypothetical protein